MGNLSSVARRLNSLNSTAIISSDANEILSADKIILPGVGHFQKAMKNIQSLHLEAALHEAVLVKKTPVLGICLGMQLMANSSEEGSVKGLGWFDAEVVKFEVEDKVNYKVPHIGWNSVAINKKSPIMNGILHEERFYFVHSYHIKMKNKQDILNETEYSYKFTSGIERENIFGVQYHPEKSHDAGNQFFKNFIAL